MPKKKEPTPAPAQEPAPKKPRKKATPKGPTSQQYITELKQMVEQRTGRPFEMWLTPQLRTTAMNMVILDRVQAQLEKDNVSSSMTGSMGQQKIESNPLFVTYDKLQRTLLMQFEALGLNYNTAKGKVVPPDGDGQAEDDPVLAALMKR